MRSGLGVDITPYWIYTVYVVGGLGFYAIGHRKWWGWCLAAFAHCASGLTAYYTGVTWAVVGACIYLVLDVWFIFNWYRLTEWEHRQAGRFINLVSRQYADGKKEAINELVDLARQVDDLTQGNTPFGRRKEDQLLIDYVRAQGNTEDADRLQKRMRV